MLLNLIPVSLFLAGTLALLNIWLTWRVGQVRRAEGVSIGDGGNERVTRRMRAHANFAENAPLVAILVLLVEVSAGSGWVLAALALVFVLARIAHPFGMDGWLPGRMAGVLATLLVQLALAGWAISIPLVDRLAPPPGATQVIEPMG